MKRKLLFAIAAFLCSITTWAQTDVTSTYLTNADFEGSYSSNSNPSADRDIYLPEGWSISYTNSEANDMTSLSSATTQWSNFSSKPQPATGSKAYWMRFRWGSSENITLSQETSTNLPAGTYCVSVDAYSDDNTGTVTISAAGASQTVRSNGAWANYKVVFTLASAQKVTVSLSYTNTAADNQVAAFDNVKILDLSSEPTGIALKNELGGTAATLSDFNVWYNDYTLEVEGTAGTEISVAADNITYTPEATGTVRFVKKDGIVYVFEGTAYKGAIHSSKADYTYSRTLSQDDPITNNYLANPSFETTGANISGSKYKFGDPWTTNYSGSDIRIDKGTKSGIHGTCVLVWRGSGSGKDWYFSQQISLPKYKGVKVFLQQIDGGNANAKFNVGVGNAAGDYSYVSTQFTLGSGKNGTYNAELGYNESMATGNVYFSFRNTSTNTSSSGSDPVSQIDWIGLVGSDDFPITGVSSASYVYGAAYAPATAKSSYLAAKADAEATIANATYTNVTGSERTALQAQIDAVVDDNDAAYNQAVADIHDAKDAFTAALSHYQALIVAQAAVPTLAYASSSASAFKTAVATSASDADTKVASMTTDIRTYYESHAMAEGVACPINRTSAIANPDAMDSNNGWTWEGTKNDPKNNEPWTDASGNASHWYFDGGNWGANSWTTTMRQTITIPAGKYLLTAKGRAATNTTLTMAVGSESVALPNVGSSGNVFNNGWGDASLEFTANGSDVEIVVTASTSTVHEWFSICDFRLVRIDATAAETSDYTALSNAITAAAHTLGFENGQYAPYNNVDALTYIAEGNAVNTSGNNAKDEINALTTAISNATWTANTSDVDAIYNNDFNIAGDGWNPDGWTSTGWAARVEDINSSSSISSTGKGWRPNTGTITYGNTGIYTMPLAGNQLYKLTFKYGAWDGWSVPTISVLNAEDGLAATALAGTNTNYKTAMTSQTMYFKTGAAGNYILSMNATYNMVYTDVSLVKANDSEVTLDETVAFTPVDNTFYQTLNLTRSIAEGWNTIVLPFSMTAAEITDVLGEGTLYRFDDADNGSLEFSEATALEAHVPYLFNANDAKNISAQVIATRTITEPTNSLKTNGTDYNFVGTYTPYGKNADGNPIVIGNDYVLGADAAFHQTTVKNAIKAFRAYIQANEASDVKALAICIDGEETAIQTINGEQAIKDGVIYNLAGQRVSKAQKGLYIVNGKKVLVK